MHELRRFKTSPGLLADANPSRIGLRNPLVFSVTYFKRLEDKTTIDGSRSVLRSSDTLGNTAD